MRSLIPIIPITERGLVGDRTYAVVDKQTGKIASAKNPRKWGKLFDIRSVFVDSPREVNDIPPVRITFPNGTNILSSHHHREEEDDIYSSRSQVEKSIGEYIMTCRLQKCH